VDINYFLGIDANTGVMIADFEEGAGGATPSQNHPISGTTVVSNDVWYHAAATYDGTTLKLYLNGVQENSLTVGQPAASATTAPTAFASSIRSNGTTIQGYFNGVLDEARIWNVARTQTEIQNAINSELTSGTGLIGRWGMNEGAGTTITDSTAPAENGSLTNDPVWVSPGAPFNLNYNGAPLVNAGADQVVPLQDNVELSGSVSDDGLPNPPGTVTTPWSLISGPGTVTFANANAEHNRFILRKRNLRVAPDSGRWRQNLQRRCNNYHQSRNQQRP
jgi:hypothetical protein